MPLIRRLPKRGFNNAVFHKQYAIVNLDDLNEFKTGTVINEQLLRESKLVRGHFAGIKILGDGEVKQALKIEIDKISAVAREKIEKAGGTITLRDGRVQKQKVSNEAPDLAEREAPRETGTKNRSAKKAPAKAKSRAKKKTSRES